jgi:hypothetical protein
VEIGGFVAVRRSVVDRLRTRFRPWWAIGGPFSRQRWFVGVELIAGQPQRAVERGAVRALHELGVDVHGGHLRVGVAWLTTHLTSKPFASSAIELYVGRRRGA